MPTAEQYQAKVSAYFLVTLGRPASSDELAAYSQVLADNNGSVWKPSGASLVSYLTPLLEAATAGKNNGQIVTEMFERMTGSQPSMDLYNYYVGLLNQGIIKLKGLANAMLNDLKLMPNVDGGFDQPANWPIDLSGQLTSAQRDAMIAKTGVAVEFTKQLDTVDENNAFKNDPSLAVQLLAGVTDDTTGQAAKDQIDETIQDIVSGGSAGQTFTLTAASGQVEEGTALSFTVKAAQKVDADTTFTVTITGDDNGGTLSKASAADFPADVVSSVTIKAGSDSATFDLTPVANDGTEGLEGFRVTLLDSSNKTVANSGVVAIKDGETDTTAPVVDANQAFTYDENQAEGFVVGTVKASDVGVGGAAGTIATFEIVGGNDDGFFAIDKDGKITLTEAGADKTKAANDFETTPNTFTLKVRAIDAAGNKSADTDVTLTVTDVDDIGPKFVSAAASGTTVKINFDEALKVVALSNPSALFTVTQGGASYSINTATISGNTVTLTLASALGSGDTYIAYDGTVLEDALGNKADKIDSTKATSTDTTPPTLTSSNPADNATDFAANANLTLTFNEAVKLGIGTITLVNISDATDNRVINTQDATQVSVSGNTVTINPTADLKAGTSYAVNVSATAILDEDGNAFAGISDNATLNFTTKSSTSGQTLTTGVDNITGTSAGETFDASLAVTSAGQLNTLGNADAVDGGDGTDTLFVQHINTAATTVTPTSVKNIEVLQLDLSNIAAAFTLDLANGDNQLTTIKSGNNTAAGATATVQNVQGVPTTVELSNTDQDFTLTNASSKMSGTSDAVTLKLSSVTGGTVTLQPSAAGSGYETITVDSQGTVANVLTSLTDGAGNSLAKVVVTGSQNLTLPLGDTTVTEVDASAFTGKLTNLQVAAGNTQNMKITGGSKDDVIDMNGTYTANDTINGGDDTDRLVLKNTEATGATTVQSNVSNIEVIGLSDGLNGTVTVSNFGATGLRFGADMAGAGTVSYAAGTNSLDLQGNDSGGNNLTVNVAGTATNDVLNVTLGSSGAGNTFGGGNVTINGAETVNLLVQGGAGSFGGTFTITDTAATQALVITGSQNITFTGAVRADSIDASGMTGAATLTLTGGTSTTATSITGTANGDTLNGSTAGDIINGGDGNDTIANVVTGNPATAGDVLTGGAGFDTFILRGAAASNNLPGLYNNVAYITDFTVGSTATTTDILQLSAAIGNYFGGTAFFGGVAADAAGATTVMNVAQNAGAAGIVTGTDLIKLTTGVATAGLTAQQAFNAAIGTATVTGLVAAGDDIFVMFYDTTNSRAVVGLVDSGVNTTVETTDTITIIGSISMSASDYAAFNNNNLAIIAA
ncbi:beta strand repeat-containing protein [Thermochromatium tepidum]|uniref:Cadherin domain-containing protein n=1 Tax=Thermochromatium tepidum ATCC 43061 TaxID=316276 RepID=A0A6I6EH46_THETI|nr:Ig-like domain-containing protein [Thermochromatium tepidum]QGU33540.1 hypothetical protein E6P07_11465 [Thermochromatium tepidum ATCC 43061]